MSELQWARQTFFSTGEREGALEVELLSRRWQFWGLFLVTFATLVLEVVNTRLLSVLTWYHLSFFAVSIAMLGMSAGAVHVFLGGRDYAAVRVRGTLADRALTFAMLVPLSHVLLLIIPIPDVRSLDPAPIAVLAGAIGVLATPFYTSGIVVTLALTRTGGSIGRLYAYDLLGASIGCLAVVALLNWLNITGVVLLAGVAAAAGAYCFHRFAGSGRERGALALAVGLIVAVVLSGTAYNPVRVRFAKQRPLPAIERTEEARWNSHSFVVAQTPTPSSVFYWGAGALAAPRQAEIAWVTIDGDAGTAITSWDGRLESLDWVEHDVTNAPYVFRHGNAAVIGVGGGRDILSALHSGSRRIIGIELNAILLDLVRIRHDQFAGIAHRPGVTLVHDEARSFLSRTSERFDVLQMSLIDTWAATGAGAFTLSENGLYTVEAWRIFLGALKPHGVFSVSRWFSPEHVSETTRLLALGVASLLDRGVADPSQHLIFLSRGSVATLMCSVEPFSDEDHQRLTRLVGTEQFAVIASPWSDPPTEQLAKTLRAKSLDALDAAVADPDFDYTPPTDQRPYFFNILRLGSFAKLRTLPSTHLLWGNIAATTTLVVLFLIAAILVLAMILFPLASAAGTVEMPGFWAGVAYFACIGAGYMLIQIPFLQRFSVFLGHPTYTLAIILFSMILCTGVGSFLSERLSIDPGARAHRTIPVVIALTLLLEVTALSPVTLAFTPYGITVRTLVVVFFTAPLSLLLGCCFPVGMRLVSRRSEQATAWMWGINGACGVLASIASVAISMSIGINASLLIAAILYGILVVPAGALVRDDRRAVAAVATAETASVAG